MRKTKKLTIYVVRRRKNETINGWVTGISRPCSHCTKIIKKYGIGKIVYMDENNNVISIRSKHYYTKYISPGMRVLMRQGIL